MTSTTDPSRRRHNFDPRRVHHWLAYGFGSGLSPKAPGTAGTIAAVPLYLLAAELPLIGYLLLLAVAILIGIWACGKTAGELGVQDPSALVWDEFVGFFITMTLAPAGWVWVLLGFVLFRFFDILKPWPICVFDRRVHGGWGIMLDDLLAGLVAFAALQAIAGWWLAQAAGG